MTDDPDPTLYRVTVEYELVVEADGRMKAERIARRRTRDEEPKTCFASVIYKGDSVPDDWGDCIPYGADDDKTVDQKLKEHTDDDTTA